MAGKNNYLADTTKPTQSNLNALYDMANQAGIENAKQLSYTDLTTAIKQATGTSGNIYGNTIGNKTVNQYGYTVDKAGNIVKNGTNTPQLVGGKPLTSMGLVNKLVSGLTKGAQASKEDPFIIPTANQVYNLNKGYNQQMNTLQQGHDQYITALNNGANNANAALENARNSALAGIESVYDDSARDYYRLYRTQETELPEQLSSVGATGGASESAALRLMNNYSDNLYKNESARNRDINGLNQDYYDAVAENSMRLASELAGAYLNLAQQQAALQGEQNAARQSLLQNYYTKKQAKKEADEKAAAEAAAAASEKAAKDALVARNNDVRAEEIKRQREGYKTENWTDANGEYHYRISGDKVTEDNSVDKWNSNITKRMEEQLEKGDTIWTWTDADGKKHWSTRESVGLANGGKKLAKEDKTKNKSGGKSGKGGSNNDSGALPAIEPVKDTTPKGGNKSANDKSFDAEDNSDVNSVNAQVLLRALDPNNANIFSGLYSSKGNSLTGAASYAANSNVDNKIDIYRNALLKNTKLFGGK